MLRASKLIRESVIRKVMKEEKKHKKGGWCKCFGWCVFILFIVCAVGLTALQKLKKIPKERKYGIVARGEEIANKLLGNIIDDDGAITLVKKKENPKPKWHDHLNPLKTTSGKIVAGLGTAAAATAGYFL